MRYAVILTIDDKEEEFTQDEIKEMVEYNMLDHIDNAPFEVEKVEVKRLF